MCRWVLISKGGSHFETGTWVFNKVALLRPYGVNTKTWIGTRDPKPKRSLFVRTGLTRRIHGYDAKGPSPMSHIETLLKVKTSRVLSPVGLKESGTHLNLRCRLYGSLGLTEKGRVERSFSKDIRIQVVSIFHHRKTTEMKLRPVSFVNCTEGNFLSDNEIERDLR